ncbi:glycosyltransferase [Candidatus Peregrinibacteria bacterium]|nr:glycosyltransferase [Candidatus Peregrinibacteria bacterium]
MRILMYGWEFPPFNSGGLGVACEGIVNGLLRHNTKIHLVLPRAPQMKSENFNIVDLSSNEDIEFTEINCPVLAYEGEHHYTQNLVNIKNASMYGSDLFQEVERYSQLAGPMAAKHDHDIIHAHDWLTYKAAINGKKISKKPFVAHIHATELDRSGENPNPYIFELEKMGFEHADKIIAVSDYTKRKIVQHYKIPASKIEVVHNAVTKNFKQYQTKNFKESAKKVLFLGRVTMQKGPEYFLQAAAKVARFLPETVFLMAGTGDMLGRMIHLTHDLGIDRNVLFTGFLRGADIDRAFQNADLFVMPSVSEPFGLVALESIQNGTPVLVSNQSGVSEVIPNMLKVDFWDTDEMANKIVATLKYEPMNHDLINLSKRDLNNLEWHDQALKIKNIYTTL